VGVESPHALPCFGIRNLSIAHDLGILNAFIFFIVEENRPIIGTYIRR